MARSIPWARVFAEGAVIVVSILLGLGIDAWWSGINSHRVAYADLAAVLEELEGGRTEIEAVDRWNQRMLSGLLSLRDLLEAVPVDTEVLVTDTLLIPATGLAVADPPSAVLEAFLSSGHIQEVPPGELRQGLLGWGAVLQDLRDDQVHARDLVDAELYPQVMHETGLNRGGEILMSMFFGTPLKFEHGRIPVISTQPLRNSIGYHLGWMLLLKRTSDLALAELDSLIALVRAEIQP